MAVLDARTEVGSEVAELLLAIDREATAARVTLTQDPSAPADVCVLAGVAGQHELRRQLSALHERVTCAESRIQDRRAQRSELATLFSFAKTLRTDAEVWRVAYDEALAELERQEAAARQRRERWLAAHPELVRRRAALQIGVDETAMRLARRKRGECRRTLPMVTLGGGLIVRSVTVSSPWSRFRFPKLWLVTVNNSCDEVLVRRC